MRRRAPSSHPPRLRLHVPPAAILIGLVVVQPAVAQERFRRTPPLPDALPLELRLPQIETVILPNGLSVATARRAEVPLVTLQLVVRAGEADSPPDLPGLAAITGHMIGKGTKLLSAEYFENAIESMGATFSKKVLMDYTVLTMHVLQESLDRAIFLLRLMTLEAVFTERELGAVRRTAFWELFERKKDPEILAWRQLLRLLFENHPYHTATYAEQVIKFITVSDVAAFYSRHYRPGNAVILISGNIDAAAVAKKVAAHFTSWAGPSAGPRPLPPPAPNVRDRICYIEAPDLPDAMIYAGNVIMDSSSPEFFPFLVIKQVLGGTTGSRLFMNLRESKGYAYYAFSETEFMRSCGVYWARARVRPESIVPAVREIIREIGAMSSAPAVPAEIEEAKSYLVGSLPSRFESLDGFADWMARYVALGLDDGQWDKGPERIKLVDVERVEETAGKYLAARPLVVIVGRPEWLGLHCGEFSVVEVYDTSGELKRVLNKGEGP